MQYDTTTHVRGDASIELNEGPPSKIRRTSNAQSLSGAKARRAARACEHCRSSKLRCQAPDPSSTEMKCANCAKTGRDCFYTDVPPPVLSGRDDDGESRLSRLEGNVNKLLEVVENLSTQRSQMGSMVPPLPASTNSPLAALAHLAGFNSSPARREMQPWLSNPSDASVDSLISLAQSSHRNAPNGSTSSASHIAQLPYPQPDIGSRAGFELDAQSESPAGRSGRSDPILYENNRAPSPSDGERYPTAQARPIPKVPTFSRMAAFTDPSAHEAPFRPLTYNPDTYKNSEFSRQGSEEVQDGNGASDRGDMDGRKTPKRGRGDPIDRNVFMESEARALFRFFQNEILLFLPVLQEPVSFDAIRHRSSFLLSTILAIAAKYCCSSVFPSRQALSESSRKTMDSMLRHGVNPVSEESLVQIRALAMSSFFQALISKVHCLEDVQATLLLCAWGLHDRGASPDPWMTAGLAYRLARRLGLHLASATLRAPMAQPTARTVASLQTYLCLYAFDRLLTVGFGRPETEGFDVSTIDTGPLLNYLEASLDGKSTAMALHIAPESAACIVAYVELANIAREYSGFVNKTLKAEPSACWGEMERMSVLLDHFSGRWLRARSPLAVKLGLSARPIRLLYNHIRLCLHSVPLKPATHPGSEVFLQSTGLASNTTFLHRCLKKAQDSAEIIVQAFADDARDDNDAILCFSYDYACMVLVHSAAILLRLATMHISGLDSSSSQPSIEPRDNNPDRVTAMRYCGMAITALVESDRSANRFPCDMACNLSSIAKESGMVISDWISTSVLQALEERGFGELEPFNVAQQPDLSTLTGVNDFSVFADFDSFLYPDFFENMAFLNNA